MVSYEWVSLFIITPAVQVCPVENGKILLGFKFKRVDRSQMLTILKQIPTYCIGLILFCLFMASNLIIVIQRNEISNLEGISVFGLVLQCAQVVFKSFFKDVQNVQFYKSCNRSITAKKILIISLQPQACLLAYHASYFQNGWNWLLI